MDGKKIILGIAATAIAALIGWFAPTLLLQQAPVVASEAVVPKTLAVDLIGSETAGVPNTSITVGDLELTVGDAVLNPAIGAEYRAYAVGKADVLMVNITLKNTGSEPYVWTLDQVAAYAGETYLPYSANFLGVTNLMMGERRTPLTKTVAPNESFEFTYAFQNPDYTSAAGEPVYVSFANEASFEIAAVKVRD